MPGKDLTRWTQNEEGDWTRLVPDEYKDETENDQPLPDEGYEEPDEELLETPDEDEDDYDATTGAVEAANKLGVDLGSVTGTGQGGRITKADVEAAANA